MRTNRWVQLSLIAAAFVSSWSAIAFSGVQLVDAFLVIAFTTSVLRALSGDIPSAPTWVKVGTLGLLLVMLTHFLFPTSSSYMSMRYIILPYTVSIADYVDESTAVRGAKWLLALSIVPILVGHTIRQDRRFVDRICIAWLLGICISSLAAVTDLLSVTSLHSTITAVEENADRMSGLTSHPNYLGASVAMAAPLAVWVATRNYLSGLAMVLILAGGALASGSRGGEAGFAFALAATTFVLDRSRRLGVLIALGMCIAVGAALWTRPEAIQSGTGLVRFSASTAGIEDSDEGRVALARQAVDDFLERPMTGVGLGVVASAHNIYLQWLASGGLVLAASMILYFAGALKAALAERTGGNPLGLYLFIVISVWLLLGLVENQLTDRYLYFPIGCVAGLQISRRFRGNIARLMSGLVQARPTVAPLNTSPRR